MPKLTHGLLGDDGSKKTGSRKPENTINN